MVVSGSEAQMLASKVLATWVAALGKAVVHAEERHHRFEHVVDIIPAKPGAAVIEFCIGLDRTFDLYIGRVIRAESLPLSHEYLIEICEAVRRGDIVQEEWRRKGKVLKRTMVLHLSSGHLYGTEEISVFGTWGADERIRRRYQPYE